MRIRVAQVSAQGKQGEPTRAQRRASGFLRASRVAWAQTGNGLSRGQHPVGESSAGCAPIKICPGGAGGRSPPPSPLGNAGARSP